MTPILIRPNVFVKFRKIIAFYEIILKGPIGLFDIERDGYHLGNKAPPKMALTINLYLKGIIDCVNQHSNETFMMWRFNFLLNLEKKWKCISCTIITKIRKPVSKENRWHKFYDYWNEAPKMSFRNYLTNIGTIEKIFSQFS